MAVMEVLENRQLKDYSSMRIGGPAKYVIQVNTEDEITEAVEFAHKNNLPIITLGDGTNVVFSDEGFSGVIIVNRLKGFTIEENGLVEIAGGENWDDLVEKTVTKDLIGVESLSLIPGTAGAAPVNNIGAYGQEIAETLVSVRAYDTQQNKFVEISNADCGFKYRVSRFKEEDHGRFVITKITLQLEKFTKNYKTPHYPALINELVSKNIANPTHKDVRKAVIAVRSAKLPDPKRIANCGSFFKNPLVSKETAGKLLAKYPDMPQYTSDNSVKIAAGWLVENARLKNYRQNGIWVYDKQALVLVNESAENFADLKAMVNFIKQTVFEKYGIELQPEPELL